jgi:hypothetical protein
LQFVNPEFLDEPEVAQAEAADVSSPGEAIGEEEELAPPESSIGDVGGALLEPSREPTPVAMEVDEPVRGIGREGLGLEDRLAGSLRKYISGQQVPPIPDDSDMFGLVLESVIAGSTQPAPGLGDVPDDALVERIAELREGMASDARRAREAEVELRAREIELQRTIATMTMGRRWYLRALARNEGLVGGLEAELVARGARRRASGSKGKGKGKEKAT